MPEAETGVWRSTVGRLLYSEGGDFGKKGGMIMTIENVLTMAVILVLFIIAIREWLYVLSQHPRFVAAAIILGIAYGLGPHFADAILLVLQVVVGIFVTIFIAGFLLALEETRKEHNMK